MVTDRERAVYIWMVKHKLWTLKPTIFRGFIIVPRWGTGWLYNRLKDRQDRDGLHHAPMCPANNWSGAAIVFKRCNCGAARAARETSAAKEAGK